MATYCGAVVEKMREREVQIRQGKYRLKMIFPPQKGKLLNAPQQWENDTKNTGECMQQGRVYADV